MQLSSYQTHKLIREVFPDAETVYSKSNRNQITIEEYLDSINNLPKDLYENIPGQIRAGRSTSFIHSHS